MNRSEIQSVLTASKIHLQKNAKCGVGDQLLAAIVPITESLLRDAKVDEADPPLSESKYRITGDHPMFVRQDRRAANKTKADEIAAFLRGLGYVTRIAFIERPKPEAKPPLSLSVATEYEIYGTWWSGYVPGFLSGFVANYFVFKARRKLTRFLYCKVLKLTSQSPSPDRPKAQTSD